MGRTNCLCVHKQTKNVIPHPDFKLEQLYQTCEKEIQC